ncbi:class I SAM-dependent methyltransferase [Kibdelosporangium philippinense]|uniref:Class I SAM-dependent methyltransferase n=1 Tax=Kibdelosporangium philippinense TaxID=211113 RepID=A0ABS8ZTU1_9PSEU|nr:class I SAM-dependent methyltransferase [Kibdelosporangium philippinense]MCE7010405.1 class I SAM-dependent methyltransferase [Kibdelosporangium philippinense]
MTSNDAERIWAAGNLRALATHHTSAHERVVQSTGVKPGDRVLDVGAGTGTTTLLAARSGGAVTAIDLVADFLDTARERAAAEGFEIATVVADAQDLPFEDGEFDVVVSTFAVMFAADAKKAAAELRRVSSGRIGVTSWTADGFVGQCMATLARYQTGTIGTEPLRWGDEDFVRELFGNPRLTKYTSMTQHESADKGVAFLRHTLGPVKATFDALDADQQNTLTEELKEVMARFNTARDGSVATPAEYLEVIVD